MRIELEKDGPDYFASLRGFSVNLCVEGKTAQKALKSFGRELIKCHKELNEDDNFSQAWLDFKRYLNDFLREE